MKTIQGNLITFAQQGLFDVIVQPCNCYHKMGAGLAKQVRDAYPEAYVADLRTTWGSKHKLGFFSWATVEQSTGLLTVVNAYTQHRYSRTEDVINYEAIDQVFAAISDFFPGDLRFGIPKIGAGLARGDWGRISAIIDNRMQSRDLTVVEYQ